MDRNSLIRYSDSPSFVLKYTLTPKMAPAKVSPCAMYQSTPSVTSPFVKKEIKDRTTPDTTMSAAVQYCIHSLLFVVIGRKYFCVGLHGKSNQAFGLAKRQFDNVLENISRKSCTFAENSCYGQRI